MTNDMKMLQRPLLAPLAYFRTDAQAGCTLPGMVWLGGFRSDMTGTKAVYLEEQAAARGQAFLRFDYTGHGASDGVFEDCTLSTWLQDATDVFDQLTDGPQILVGSSMGGWLALRLALARKDRVAGLIGIAAAPDFTEDIWHHEFDETARAQMAAQGHVVRDSAYGPPYRLSQDLFTDGKKHLLLHAPIGIACPVRLIHGQADPDVPWQKSETIKKRLASADVTITYIPDGDHRLSRPEDLEILGAVAKELSLKTAA